MLMIYEAVFGSLDPGTSVQMIQSQLLILLSVLIYGLIHSLLATLGVKARARRFFGPAADRWYRLAYNFFGILSFLPVLSMVVVLPDRQLYVIPSPWVYLTLGGQLAAAVALVVSILQTGLWSFLGVRQAFGTEGENSEKLVTTGLYRWVRHPIYIAGLIFIWLAPVMTGNLLALNLGLTIYLIVGAIYEERKLIRVFGEEYTRYREKTPMLIPGLRWKALERRKV